VAVVGILHSFHHQAVCLLATILAFQIVVIFENVSVIVGAIEVQIRNRSANFQIQTHIIKIDIGQVRKLFQHNSLLFRASQFLFWLLYLHKNEAPEANISHENSCERNCGHHSLRL